MPRELRKPFARMTIERPTCWEVRAGCDWAYIVVSEESGLVSIVSSRGKYGYIWPPRFLGTDTVHDFLVEIDFGYAMGKFIGQRKCLDLGKSLSVMRRSILDGRRNGTWGAKKARLMWDELDGILHGASEYEFLSEIEHSEYARSVDDWYMDLSYDYPAEAYGFWSTLWSVFVEAVKSKMEVDQEVVAHANED